jgi:hypothetical protein
MTATSHTTIRDAWRAAGGAPYEFVRLADLRKAMPADMTRAEVDAMLIGLGRAGALEFSGDSNAKARSQADRDAALTFGGSENQLVAIQEDRWPADTQVSR